MASSFSVLILDGGDYEALKILRCFGQAPEVTSHILSRNHRPLSRFSRYCKMCHYNASTNDIEWVEVIKDIAGKHKIDVLLPATNEGIEFVSRNYEALAEIAAVPPTPEYKMLKIAEDKWSFYCFLKEHGLKSSPTILFADQSKIVSKPEVLDSIEFPALLKPTREMGGKGIIKIDSRSDLYDTIEKQKVLQPGQRYIIQSYIPGEDLCLGVCCRQGKILSYVVQKDLSSQNNSFSYQKVMEYVCSDMAMEAGSMLVSSMAWDGMAFIDMRIDKRDNSIKLLEVNPRLGRALLGALAAGVNFPLNLCHCAMGLNITDEQIESVRYAHPSAYLGNLRARISGKKVTVKIKWHESGLRYSVADPLPDIVDVSRRIKTRLKNNLGHLSKS